jgi:GTP-binding protein
MIHIVDAASVEGRDPIADIYAINKELEAYNPEIAKRPQIIAANKIDAFWNDEEDPIANLKAEFEPQGIPVYPISAVSGTGLNELLWAVSNMLKELPQEKIVFEQEFFPEDLLVQENLPFYVYKNEDEDHAYTIEGPKIERMLGYTNLDSEKGFQFFLRFLKDTGILDELEALGIEEGDTVHMYGYDFDYYK